jgi:glycosyltransferase involved in cell wall biosynthesis
VRNVSYVGHVPPKLAIVATHPIQYYAPWFACLARHSGLDIRVFYLWDFGVAAHVDRGFQVPVTWDVPLLEGYSHEFVKNRSRKPGTAGYFGLWNPGLPRRVRSWQPDAVLLTAYNYASIGHFLLRRRAGDAPLIFRGDSHRLAPRSGWREFVKRGLIAAVFRRFSAALYVGSANREYFLQHGVPAQRLFYAPHAVDNERFFAARAAAEAAAPAWKRSLGIPEDHRVVLFAGKFEEKKRPLDLLRAFRDARLEKTSLLYVGSGPLEAAMRAAAAGMSDVFFSPFRNQSEMPLAYAACDLFVLPSFGPSETWGLAVNEAMCMGRPVIASDHVGCARDLVLPGETGLSFPAGDAGALGAALRSALAEPARLKAWGARANEHIRGFSYENATAGLLAALRFLQVAAS